MPLLEELVQLLKSYSSVTHNGFQCATGDLTVVGDGEPPVRGEFMAENNVAAGLVVYLVAKLG
jgi:hypothetical protein